MEGNITAYNINTDMVLVTSVWIYCSNVISSCSREKFRTFYKALCISVQNVLFNINNAEQQVENFSIQKIFFKPVKYNFC